MSAAIGTRTRPHSPPSSARRATRSSTPWSTSPHSARRRRSRFLPTLPQLTCSSRPTRCTWRATRLGSCATPRAVGSLRDQPRCPTQRAAWRTTTGETSWHSSGASAPGRRRRVAAPRAPRSVCPTCSVRMRTRAVCAACSSGCCRERVWALRSASGPPRRPGSAWSSPTTWPRPSSACSTYRSARCHVAHARASTCARRRRLRGLRSSPPSPTACAVTGCRRAATREGPRSTPPGNLRRRAAAGARADVRAFA